MSGTGVLRGIAATLRDSSIPFMLTGSFAATAHGVPRTTLDIDLVIDPTATAATIASDIQIAQGLWKYAGTPLGMCVGFYMAGLGTPLVVQQNGLVFQLGSGINLADLVGATSPPSWVLITTLSNGNPALPASTDGRPAVAALTVPWWMFDAGMDAAGNQYCSRFAIVYPPGTTQPNYGLANLLNRAQSVIARWKPAHARCMGIWEATSGVMWGTPATVWGVGTWGGTSSYYVGEV